MKTLILTLIFSSALYANEPTELYTTLNQKLLSPKSLEEAVTQGKDRASFCKHCHGESGNSKRGYIPNLAAQNATYLLYQLELFASKQRKDKIMSELASNLSRDERINIALFYSTQKVKLNSTKQTDIQQAGEKIFNARCATCHGENGHGLALLPRLAGQPIKYLTKTLRKYQANTQRRPDSPMQGIAAALSKNELKWVVSFISSMN